MAQPSALGSVLRHPQLPASASLHSPCTAHGDAAISAELGNLVWKKQEDIQVTSNAHSDGSKPWPLWKYYFGGWGENGDGQGGGGNVVNIPSLILYEEKYPEIMRSGLAAVVRCLL